MAGLSAPPRTPVTCLDAKNLAGPQSASSLSCADGCLSDGANGGLKGVLASRCPNQLADGAADLAFLACFLCETIALACGLESVLWIGIRFAPDAAEHYPSGPGTASRRWGPLEMGVPIAPRGFSHSLADLSAPSGSNRSGFREREFRPQSVCVLTLHRIRHAPRRGAERNQMGKATLRRHPLISSLGGPRIGHTHGLCHSG